MENLTDPNRFIIFIFGTKMFLLRVKVADPWFMATKQEEEFWHCFGAFVGSVDAVST